MRASDFKDLETRGFVLIPSFLPPAELQVCREDFASQPVNADNRNLKLSGASGKAHQIVRERVQEVLALVTQGTSLHVDLPLGAVYFATARFAWPGFKPFWHQDHESFFETQNHYDYLNFYIPINKPRRDKSNLCIIPFDVLEKESPGTFRTLVRGGAARFFPSRDRTLVYLDDTGLEHVMHKDLEQLAHAPELDAGDLLLLRGDMIHRTQDIETERVSLSFRAASSGTQVRRSRLADGGLVKALMMMNNERTYRRMFEAFDTAGKNGVPFAELQHTIANLPDSAPLGRKRFFRYLLQQKAHEQILLRFFRRSFTPLGFATVLAGLKAFLSERRARHTAAAGSARAL